MKKVIILGAGPVGLICGWLLSQKRWDVSVYEKNNSVGGMCRSWKWKDNILDTGPHIFHTPNKELWEFWKKHFGDLLVEGKYYAKNVIGEEFNTFHNYPLSIEGLKTLPKDTQAKILKEIKNLSKEKNKTLNFEEHIQNQIGKTLQSLFFKEYPEKVWGEKTTNMTSDWAPKRIKFRKKIKEFFFGEKTAVGKFGTGKIYERIKDNIQKNKGKIYINHEITSIKSNSEYKIIEINFKNKKKIIIDNNTLIISSLPITFTSRLLGYDSKLKFRGIRSVYIEINKKRVFPKKTHWIYYANKSVIFNRISEPKLMSPRVSSKNKTYLCAEIAFSKGDQIDKMDLKQLKRKIINDLEKVKLVNKEDVINISDNKEYFVYPVQFVDYKYELAKTKYQISKFGQLYSIGTGGEFDYADSQILFHKSFDLVNLLDNKIKNQDKRTKDIISNRLNTKVFLNKTKVGEGEKPYIIAEAGLNHNGNIKIAKQLIDEAKKIGCDAIKFQTYTAKKRVSKKVSHANYAEKADGLQENIYEMFEGLELSKKNHFEIFRYARQKKIEIFSTPFDITDVELLEALGVNFYKIASVDLTNHDLIKRVGLTGKPLILSTGMSDIGDIEDSINIFKKTGNKNLILLHCVSSYPANELEMNLNCIKSLKNTFQVPVGLSDHYPGLEMSYVSLSIGSNIIERHFTIDKKMEGPDHILSSDPDEMKKLVIFASKINFVLGDGQKIIQPSEYFTINQQRKSLFAKKNIKKGEKFSERNISIIGPALGLDPKYKEIIINKRSTKNIKINHPITWEHVLN